MPRLQRGLPVLLVTSTPPRELLEPCWQRHLDRRPYCRLVHHDTRRTLPSALARIIPELINPKGYVAPTCPLASSADLTLGLAQPIN